MSDPADPSGYDKLTASQKAEVSAIISRVPIGPNIGYDELLESRVKQLKKIDEKLEDIQNEIDGAYPQMASASIRSLRLDMLSMILEAEGESNAF